MTTEDKIKKLAKDLLAISEEAMPDSYFQTDTRVKFAKKVLKELKAPKILKVPELAKPKLNLKNIGELEQMNTRQLMSVLAASRKTNGVYYPDYGNQSNYYTAEEIKTVLADRPHIPNKQEAKEIRRKKAQGK